MNAQLVEITNEEYKEMLNSCYNKVTISSITFNPGDIVENLNPTAFRCGLDNYAADNERWKCDNCGEQFNDEEEAEHCCMTECDYCGKWHNTEEEAEICCDEEEESND